MGNFSALEHLIQIYFGQDSYEITGATTLPSVMSFYLQDTPSSKLDTLSTDSVEFEEAYPESLDEEFSARWGTMYYQSYGEQRQRIFWNKFGY